jgi:hypothetical protein
MKLYGLFALVLLLHMPASAQNTQNCGHVFQPVCSISTTGQSLQGTWVSQVAEPGGGFVPFAVDTFHADGSLIGVNKDSSHSAHIGVWLRVGDRQFVFMTTFFTHDERGVFNGIVKARGTITLSEDQKSYDAVVERVVMDTSGREIQVISGIRGHSVRLELELQHNPPQP